MKTQALLPSPETQSAEKVFCRDPGVLRASRSFQTVAQLFGVLARSREEKGKDFESGNWRRD